MPAVGVAEPHCTSNFRRRSMHHFVMSFLVQPTITGAEAAQFILRWFHLIAGITWIGLLYFFNLVNVPFMKELDAATKGKVMPALMTRALWWFRMSAALTVLAGLAYFGNIVGADARNGGGSVGAVMGSFFLIWTIVWGVLYACLIPGKGIFDN